jgi:hypothetical protein
MGVKGKILKGNLEVMLCGDRKTAFLVQKRGNSFFFPWFGIK